jgi:hypothetical protein
MRSVPVLDYFLLMALLTVIHNYLPLNIRQTYAFALKRAQFIDCLIAKKFKIIKKNKKEYLIHAVYFRVLGLIFHYKESVLFMDILC